MEEYFGWRAFTTKWPIPGLLSAVGVLRVLSFEVFPVLSSVGVGSGAFLLKFELTRGAIGCNTLGSPVPFTLFFGFGFASKVTNQKRVPPLEYGYWATRLV